MSDPKYYAMLESKKLKNYTVRNKTHLKSLIEEFLKSDYTKLTIIKRDEE